MTPTRAFAVALIVFVGQLCARVWSLFDSLDGPLSDARALIPDAGDYAAMAGWAAASGALALALRRLPAASVVLAALQARPAAVLRLGLLLAVAAALRGTAMLSRRPELDRDRLPRLLEVLEKQREDPLLFLGGEISEDYIRKASGLVKVSGPPPTLAELRAAMFVENCANHLSVGLDRYDHNVERFLLLHQKEAAGAVVQRLLFDVEGLTLARGGFVLERMRSERPRIIELLRTRLAEQEASQYGKYRAMVLAAALARLDPGARGIQRHLRAALAGDTPSQLRVMGAETLSRMGLRAWPAALSLTLATFSDHPDVSAAARRAILRAWVLPAFPFAFLEAFQQVVTPFGLAAALVLGSLAAFSALRLSAAGRPLTLAALLAELEPDRTTTKWILFWAFCCGVPTLAFYVVAAGIVPAIMYPLLIVLLAASGQWSELPILLVLNGAHFLLYGSVFYAVAAACAALLDRLPPRPRLGLLFGALSILALSALSPIYLQVGHNSSGPPRSAFRLLRSR